MLGVDMQLSETSHVTWTRPVPAEEVSGKPVHGHVFSLQADGTFVPYELEEGEVNPRAAAVEPGFFQEFASFLHLNELSGLIALQVLEDAGEERRVELPSWSTKRT